MCPQICQKNTNAEERNAEEWNNEELKDKVDVVDVEPNSKMETYVRTERCFLV